MCGRSDHKFTECKYNEYICNVCNVKGHLAKECKKSNFKNNFIEMMKSNDNESYYFNMFNLNSSNIAKEIMIELLVNEVLLEMELNTGSSESILPEYVLKEKFSKCVLKPILMKLRTYDGIIIKPLGEVEMVVCYKSIRKECNFVVVKINSKPLIG